MKKIPLILTTLILAAALLLAACTPEGKGERRPGAAEQTEAGPACTGDAERTDDDCDEHMDSDYYEHPAAQTFREATLYYVSDEGFVVPVKKAVPKQEGIASACLAYLTSSSENDAYASSLGLRTVLPAGTGIRLAISGGEAKLDLMNMAPFEDEEAERNAMAALIDTLCEFATVDRVTVTRDGAGGALEHGTALPVGAARMPLNVEETELAASAGAQPRTLYFPNLSGARTVPVTRYFAAEPSLYATVAALIDGPKDGRLMGCFPEGTLLLGAALENGVATVNLSSDFAAAADTEGLCTLARETLLRTLREGFSVDSVTIQVNGREFEAE